MKKLTLFSAIALFSFSTFAQDKKGAKEGISFGAKAGVTFPTISLSGDNDAGSTSFSSRTGFYVGGIVDIPVGSVLSVQPGLSLVGKGAADKTNSNIKSTPLYLELPVNLVAKFEAGPGKVFVGAGPYVALGIAGKYKYVNSDNTTGSRDLKFGSNATDDFKSIDFGLNFLLGYQLTNGLSVNGGYGLGLSNISPTSGTGIPKVKHNVFSVGLGYNF